RLREQAELLEQSVNRVFLDAERGCYRDPGSRGAAGYRQTSNLLPLAFGIVPPARVGAVVGNLVADIVARGDHHDCGHLGVRHLLPVLSAHGHGALAWRVLTAPRRARLAGLAGGGELDLHGDVGVAALLLPLLHGHAGDVDP